MEGKEKLQNGQSCDYCGFISDNPSDLKSHKANTHDGLILQCNQYELRKGAIETRHLQMHIDDPNDERRIPLLKTTLETQGNLNPPVEDNESVPKGWKINQDKDVPGDERKVNETLIETIFETQGLEVKGIESVPDGWKVRQDIHDPGEY